MKLVSDELQERLLKFLETMADATNDVNYDEIEYLTKEFTRKKKKRVDTT